MIIKSKKRKKSLQSNWFIFFILLIISIIFTYYLYNNSLLFINPIKSLKLNFLIYLLDIQFYFLIIIIIFNFRNIYQTIILFYALLFPQIILFIAKTLINNDINQNLFYDFFSYILFYLILGKITFFKEDNIYNKKLYIIYIVFIIGILFLIANTLAIINFVFVFVNKIISGFLIAFSCYYFIFKVLNIKHNNGLQLFKFTEKINNNILIILLFVLIIIVIYLKIYNKSFTLLLYLLNIIIPLIGVKYEIQVIFNKNKINWKNYNFDIEDGEDEENNNINNNINMNNLISKIKITKSIKWNKTSKLYHLLRLIFLIFVFCIISYFSSKIENNDIKIAFLLLCSNIFIFILSKILMKWMELINMTYFFLESDSISNS